MAKKTKKTKKPANQRPLKIFIAIDKKTKKVGSWFTPVMNEPADLFRELAENGDLKNFDVAEFVLDQPVRILKSEDSDYWEEEDEDQ